MIPSGFLVLGGTPQTFARLPIPTFPSPDVPKTSFLACTFPSPQKYFQYQWFPKVFSSRYVLNKV